MSESVVSLLSKFSIVLLVAGSVGAQAEQVVEVTNKSYWLCKNLKQVRTIRMSVDKAGVCTTFYSKDGSEKSVGSGKNHNSCMDFLMNVKRNLENSNWTCRDISSTNITASSVD